MIQDPFANPTGWDTVTIGGISVPGVVELSDAAREYDWDVKKGKGAAGATTTFTSKPPAEFTVRVRLWEPDHFVADDAILILITYDPEKGLPIIARDVYHPALSQVGISSCVTKKIGIITHKGDGEFEREIRFLEYKPPPPVSAVSTPSQSASDGALDGASVDPLILAKQNTAAAKAALARAALAP